jgi:hypothetical protein
MCGPRRNVHPSFAFISSTYTCYRHKHWLLHHPLAVYDQSLDLIKMTLQVQNTCIFILAIDIARAMKFSFFRSFLLSIFLCFFSIIKLENGPSPSHFPNEGSHSVCRLATPFWDSWPDDGLRASSFDCCFLGFFRHRLWPDDGYFAGSPSVCHPFLFTIFRCLKYSKVFSDFMHYRPITARLSQQHVHYTSLLL